MARTALLLLAAALVVAGAAAAAPKWHELEARAYDFEQYKVDFKKSYAHPEEHDMRRARFEEQLAAIKKHNADPTKTWREGVNHMTDWTEDEFRSMLGYDRATGYKLTGDGRVDHEEQARKMRELRENGLPDTVDWRNQGVVTPVKDQGQCGSCWTFATTETVESHYAVKYGAGALMDFSEQQVASCSPNPLDCGGTGGCEGGTAEVGYAGITKAGGLATEWTYPYVSYFGTDQKCTLGTEPNLKLVAQVTDYRKLTPNGYADLHDTLANVGPVAVSVAAGSWARYESGIFGGCNTTDPIIDHAVQAVGYGTDSAAGGDYWLIRNSWASSWGENGYIRLPREGASAKPSCAIDTEPAGGTGCHGGPTQVTVCGACGVLYDSAIPIIG